jgi:hypothetical protein
LMELSAPMHGNERENIFEVAKKAIDWWSKNCFFLDKDSREKFLKLTKMASLYSVYISKTGDLAARVYDDTWNLLGETINAVQDGIKIERLDVLERPEEKKEN